MWNNTSDVFCLLLNVCVIYCDNSTRCAHIIEVLESTALTYTI